MYVFSPLKVILVQQETGRAKRQSPPLLLGLCQEQLCQQFPAASLRQTSAFFIVRFFSWFFILFYFYFFLSPRELSISTKHLASISRPPGSPAPLRATLVFPPHRFYALCGVPCAGKAILGSLPGTWDPSVPQPAPSRVPHPSVLLGGPTARWGCRWDARSGDAYPWGALSL